MQRSLTVTNQDFTNLSLCINVLKISRNNVGSSGEKKPLLIWSIASLRLAFSS